MSDNRDVEFDLKKCEYNTLSTIINYEYSCNHKYDFKYFQPLINNEVKLANCLSPNKKPRHAAWSKILSCIKVIEEGCKYDFVVYLDSDCVFNHHETSLIEYLNQAKNILNQNVDIEHNIFFMNNQPWSRNLPCSGFFMFRPNIRSHEFFKQWYRQEQEEKFNLHHPWEQYCLHTHLIKEWSFEIIDDWMFQDRKQNQYLRHIGQYDILRKTFFYDTISSYSQQKIQSHIDHIKDSVIRYETSDIKYGILS